MYLPQRRRRAGREEEWHLALRSVSRARGGWSGADQAVFVEDGGVEGDADVDEEEDVDGQVHRLSGGAGTSEGESSLTRRSLQGASDMVRVCAPCAA